MNNRRVRLHMALFSALLIFLSVSGLGLLTLSTLLPLPKVQASPGNVILFEDNFDNYTDNGRKTNIGVAGVDPTVPWRTSTSTGDFIADGRGSSSTTLPWGPPHGTYTMWQGWDIAGGNGTSSGCNSSAEQCTYWINNPESPNSIAALSQDEAHSGSYSFEVGDGDTYNKINPAFSLYSTFTPGAILSQSFWVWLSPGTVAGGPSGREEWLIAGMEGVVFYNFASGQWGYGPAMASEPGTPFPGSSVYRLTASTWHEIDIRVNTATGDYDSVLIDGVNRFGNIQSAAAGGAGISRFAWFIDGKSDRYTSVYSASECAISPQSWCTVTGTSNAVYYFLDDILIQQLGTSTTTSTSATSTTTSPSVTTTTSSATKTSTASTGTTASSTGGTGTTDWSANFETGSQSQFDGTTYNTCSPGSIGVTKTIVHSGTYAGNYTGTSGGAANCREYVTNDLPSGLTDFYFSGWFYLPSSTISSWVSLATFSTSVNWNYVMTLDASSNRQLYIFTNYGAGSFHQSGTPVAFPFNTWFHLELYAHGIGSSTATAVLYQNGQQIVSASGDLMAGAMDSVHFGLYVESTSIVTILNDDLLINNLGSSSTSTTTHTSTSSTLSSSSTSTSTTPTTSRSTTTTHTSTSSAAGSTTLMSSVTITSGSLPTVVTSSSSSTSATTHPTTSTTTSSTVTTSPTTTQPSTTIISSVTTSSTTGTLTQLAIISPKAESNVSGVVTLEIWSPTPTLIQRVQYYIDGNLLTTVTSGAPFSCQWNTTSVANGSHQIIAEAYDSAGNMVETGFKVNVDN